MFMVSMLGEVPVGAVRPSAGDIRKHYVVVVGGAAVLCGWAVPR